MFTGLIEALGTVAHIDPEGAGRRLVITAPTLAPQLKLGESVAVNGVCLTVVQVDAAQVGFQAGPETLAKTNLSELIPGHRVNLERSLQVGDRLGGHWVQGHVDGVGHIASRRVEGEWEMVWFDCPEELCRQMVRKGSIAVDGVSLTVVDVEPTRFSVALIPHTLSHTTLGHKPGGATVNLETDILGKYVRKLLESMGPKFL